MVLRSTRNDADWHCETGIHHGKCNILSDDGRLYFLGDTQAPAKVRFGDDERWRRTATVPLESSWEVVYLVARLISKSRCDSQSWYDSHSHRNTAVYAVPFNDDWSSIVVHGGATWLAS